MNEQIEATNGKCELCLKGSNDKEVFVLTLDGFEEMRLCPKHMHVLLSKKLTKEKK